ncbi:MAG TPA: exodeoxyribonuclease VII large subunit, partial [Gemmatimonadaceae bacterium]|nr:exodeoxyribonuclease VII large subunit [Gemmatimonadaceae bacterium]
CAVPLLADERAALGAMELQLGESCARRIAHAGERLGALARALTSVSARTSERQQLKLEALAGRLHALSPLATLARGYAVARDVDGATLSSAGSFSPTLPFVLTLRDGRVAATAGERLPDVPAIQRDAARSNVRRR